MTTGASWNISDPLHPFCAFDPDDVVNIPFDFEAWLTGQGTTFEGYAAEYAEGLEGSEVGVTDGVILLQVKRADAATLVDGEDYGVTVQCEAADGQKLSQTLFLRIGEK